MIDLADIDLERSRIAIQEKNGVRHTYEISREGLEALRRTTYPVPRSCLFQV